MIDRRVVRLGSIGSALMHQVHNGDLLGRVVCATSIEQRVTLMIDSLY